MRRTARAGPCPGGRRRRGRHCRRDTFSFAIELFGSWGVGSAESDNGLGVLLVRNLHEIRFITGGGLEGILPDALCKRIQMKYMLPAFRQEDYDAGMLAGLAVTAEVLAGGTPDLSEPEGELSGGAILAIVASSSACSWPWVFSTTTVRGAARTAAASPCGSTPSSRWR